MDWKKGIVFVKLWAETREFREKHKQQIFLFSFWAKSPLKDNKAFWPDVITQL